MTEMVRLRGTKQVDPTSLLAEQQRSACNIIRPPPFILSVASPAQTPYNPEQKALSPLKSEKPAMTVQRLAQFPLGTLRPILEAQGWDVSLGDTLQAELQDARGRFRLVADRSGRVMMRCTMLAQEPQDRIVQRGEQTYAVQRELRAVTHVTTQLASAEAFGQVLDELIELSLTGPQADDPGAGA